jgi:hypothetical protein
MITGFLWSGTLSFNLWLRCLLVCHVMLSYFWVHLSLSTPLESLLVKYFFSHNLLFTCHQFSFWATISQQYTLLYHLHTLIWAVNECWFASTIHVCSLHVWSVTSHVANFQPASLQPHQFVACMLLSHAVHFDLTQISFIGCVSLTLLTTILIWFLSLPSTLCHSFIYIPF